MKNITFILFCDDNLSYDIQIYMSYDNWQKGDDMKLMNDHLEHSKDLSFGYHEYKYYNTKTKEWFINNKEQIINNNGNINNVIHVKENDNIIKIIHTSDTHSLFQNVEYGDIFIHTGDFSIGGYIEEYKIFNNWLLTLPHKYKIIILGNHDLEYIREKMNLDPLKKAKEMITNGIILNSEEITIENLKIFGFEWYWYHNWKCETSYLYEGLEEWWKLPDNVDILLTHMPPRGILDDNYGSKKIFEVIQNKKPKYHLFGHIHQSYGYQYHNWGNNIGTTFINSSAVTLDSKKIINKPHVIFINKN